MMLRAASLSTADRDRRPTNFDERFPAATVCANRVIPDVKSFSPDFSRFNAV
jgi:hypothetical protein